MEKEGLTLEDGKAARPPHVPVPRAAKAHRSEGGCAGGGASGEGTPRDSI
jgi:hypothetical protein